MQGVEGRIEAVELPQEVCPAYTLEQELPARVVVIGDLNAQHNLLVRFLHDARGTIPEEQLIISEGQARITFRPGPGQAVETFQAGQNCASVVYFPLTSPDQQFTRNWCFSVV